MKKPLLVFILLLACATFARAKDLPSYPMSQLVVASDAVVYCEELDIQKVAGGRTQVKCKILETFKGDLAKGAVATVGYSDFFGRNTFTKSDPKEFPPGKTLLFLKKDNTGSYKVLDAKLVQGGKIFGFTQMTNPGGLWLMEQKPENIKLPKDQPYGEKEFLEDFAIALANSSDATLKSGGVEVGRPL